MQLYFKCREHVINVRFLWTLPIILTLMLPLKALGDDSFRCKGHIISIGDDKTEVLDICGQPEHSEEWEEWHYVEDINDEDVYVYNDDTYRKRNARRIHPKNPVMVKRLFRMERWVYNFGSTQFKRYLEFRNNELIKIETGDKGRN
jgi:hypothetical protein